MTPGLPHPDETLPSIGDLFQGRGYYTGFFGKWHTGLQYYGQGGTANPNVTPLFLGFDAWRAGSPSNVSNYFFWNRVDDGTVTPGVTAYADTALVEAFNAWWQETAGTPRKRFAYVGLRLAHGPLHQPPLSLLPTGHPVPESARQQFECMVMALDKSLDLMIRFDATDPDGEVDLSETLVVFVADNGTPVSAAGPQPPGKLKGSTYEGGIRVPLVIAGPDFPSGRVEPDQIVSAVDLFATLSTWLRGLRPRGVAEDSIAIQSRNRRWSLAEHVTATKDELALVWDDWKLRRIDGVEELYDLGADPTETSPLDPLDPAHATVMAVFRTIEASLPPRL